VVSQSVTVVPEPVMLMQTFKLHPDAESGMKPPPTAGAGIDFVGAAEAACPTHPKLNRLAAMTASRRALRAPG
jgi:hypothetical protein